MGEERHVRKKEKKYREVGKIKAKSFWKEEEMSVSHEAGKAGR